MFNTQLGDKMRHYTERGRALAEKHSGMRGLSMPELRDALAEKGERVVPYIMLFEMWKVLNRGGA